MPPANGSRPQIELALVANNVEVLNKRNFQRGNEISVENLNDIKRFWKKYDHI